MPVVSGDIWKILYTVSRYLFPLLAVCLVFLVLFYILSESRNRREKVRGLPGSGTVGELIVLSGSRDLEANTWFPVPREGVLGSIRSCDLVIPCPGVHTRHLDFSWSDGLGLLLRPRTGCEVQVNGVPVTCRTRAADVPLTHGGILQVGSATLRLHLFAALDNTPASASPAPAEMPPMTVPGFVPYPAQPGEPYSPVPVPPASMQTVPDPMIQSPDAPPLPAEDPLPPPAVSELPRRSDRWKEDLGE